MRPVLALLVLVVTGVLAADEHPVASPAATIPPGTQRAAAVATDGSGFLTIWNDHRSFGSDFPRIWAVQTNASGKRSSPILLQDQTIGATPEWPWDPYDDQMTVVWTGAVYLAVWYDWPARKTHTMRLDRTGHKLDAVPREIATRGQIVGAASDGTRTMVAVLPNLKPAQLLFFDANGEPARDPLDMAYGTVPIAFASNGHGFLMIYSMITTGTSSQSYMGPISADGVLGSSVPFDFGRLYCITTDGTDYLVVYRDHVGFVAYYRYDATGRLVGGRHGVDASTSGASATPYLSGWLVQTASPAGSRLRHLDHDGVYLEDVPMAAPDAGGVLATNGSQVLYAHGHLTTSVLYQQILGNGPDELLQPGPPTQTQPRLTGGGKGYAALWDEARETKELRAARVDAHGAPLDGEGLVVTRSSHYDGSTAIAFDGANYIAAWGDNSAGQCSIHLARITPEGTLPDGLNGHLVYYACVPRLALGSGPDRVLLVWTQFDGNAYGSSWALVMDRNQIPISNPVRLPEAYRDAEVAVGWNGTNWLVAWTSSTFVYYNGYHYTYYIYTARIAADGSLVGQAARVIAQSFDNENALSVGSNGADFVVAWQSWDATVLNPPYSLHALRVSPDGTPGASVSLGSGTRPSASWTGTDYVVGFQDGDALYTTTLGQPSKRQLLATAGGSNSTVMLAFAASGSLANLYLRNAWEWPYLTTLTAFLNASAGPHRRAAH